MMEKDCDMNFEKVSGCQFFKGSSLANKFKFCKNVSAVWGFFKKLLLIIS